jgi:hypothetical protein
MNIAELKVAAEAATVLDHNETEGWYGADDIESQGAYYPKNARFIALANPAAILKLIAVVEAAKCCLEDVVLQEEIMGIRNALKELET